jgi:membrane fusion protein, hemolysin D
MLGKLYARLIKFSENSARIRRDQLAFLPAALEVQETPPSPMGRAISWTLMALFVIAVAWACIGKLDIVAVAVGKVIPSERTKTVQPLEKGVIAQIHIREGQAVREGKPLVTLDGTQTAADETRLRDDLQNARSDWLRARAFQLLLDAGAEQGRLSVKSALEQSSAELSLFVTGHEAEFHVNVLQAQRDEYLARRHSLESTQYARQGELEHAQSLKRKLQRTLPLITERADSIKTVYQKGLMAREQYLALEQERIAQEQDLLAHSARVRELAGEVDAVKQQVLALDSEVGRDSLLALMEARQRAIALEQEWIKAQQRNRQQVIHAPISGTVQQLAVHTIGGVVTPAQDLMLIVPEHSKLEVEAFVQNKDIGFVEEGQAAEVKVDTFNFTRYGTIKAELKSISNDAVADDTMGLVYPARVVLESARIKVADRWVELSPGMAVTVEVKTGKRRIIEYFLSPLLRYKQESIRER